MANARRWPYAVSWSRAKGKDPRAADVGATVIYLSDREARSLGRFIEVLSALLAFQIRSARAEP